MQKRILLFTDSLGSGGAQRQLVGLAKLLSERKYNIKIITYHRDAFYKKDLKDYDVEYEYIKKANSKLTRIYYIRKEMLRYSPDYVISYQEIPSIITCICKILGLKSKIIVSERNTTQYIDFNEKIRFFLYRWADSIVSNSFSQNTFIKNNFPELSNKSKVIVNFVDSNLFFPNETYIENECLNILILARIAPQKNIIRFIEAIKKVTDNGYNLKVSWYGSNKANIDYFNECNIALIENGLEYYFKFFPPVDNVLKLYHDSDVLCLPSIYEGTPNVILEAMACGLPILCSNVCDNPIIVEENINGFMFDPLDINNIAEKIILLLNLPKEKKQIIKNNNINKVKQMFSKKIFVERYINLLQKN